MNLIGKRLRLIISDPWELTKIIDGRIAGIHHFEERESFLLIEENITGEKYIITNRYVGDNVMLISSVKKIIVSIGLPKTSEFTFDDPTFPSNLLHYGRGSIELMENSQED